MQSLELPYAFELAGPHTLLKYINPALLDFSHGFLRDSINSLPAQHQVSRIEQVKKAMSHHENPPAKLPRIGFIFHVARCGSTLLCQNLKQTGRFLVLGEPGFLNQLYNEENILSTEVRKKLLLYFLSCWSDYALRQNRMLIVKTTSLSLIKLEQILNGIPNASILHLYREPVATTESMLRSPPGYIKSQACSNDYCRLPEHLASQIDNPEVLQVARHYLTMITKIQTSNTKHSLTCDYSELKNSFSGIVSFFLNKNIDIADKPFPWSDKWNSKKGAWKTEIYTPVQTDRLDLHYGKYRDLMNYLMEHYASTKKSASIQQMSSH